METCLRWKTDLATLTRLCREAERAQVTELTQSAGGRPVYAFAYGEAPDYPSCANYSSACGAHDLSCYKPAQRKPAILLIGAEHGFEVEGTAALYNLISLLETGLDLAGQPNEALCQAAERVRLVIVPMANPDGRARVPPASAHGMQHPEFVYWSQGSWADGSLCGWPDCKKVHPIRDTAFLGGYFNDDGINIMHDLFFHPMARETQAILDLAAAERADCTLHLHGGTNSVNDLLPTAYVTEETSATLRALAERCRDATQKEGLNFSVPHLPGKECGPTPPSFNLASAVHHVSGGVSAVFESNQCIEGTPGTRLSKEEILRAHMILFETCFRLFDEMLNPSVLSIEG